MPIRFRLESSAIEDPMCLRPLNIEYTRKLNKSRQNRKDITDTNKARKGRRSKTLYVLFSCRRV